MRYLPFPAILLALLILPTDVRTDGKQELVLGEFELERNTGVVDGDTIRCWKLDGGVRLLCVDAEETFKSLDDRKAAGKDWDAYAAAKAAENDLPVKYGSFMGEEAWHYARDFFRDVKTVRLEYDTTTRKQDIYGRHLCYVFATRKGQKDEENFCVELVREGYSPYSAKYGHSTRFRRDFEKAEKEARAGKRGIWGEKPMAYRDYDVRCKWWNERAEQLEQFSKDHGSNANAIELANDDTADKLKAHEGKEVVLLCNMPEFKDDLFGTETPPHIRFVATQETGLHVHFKDAAAFTAAGADRLRGRYVIVKGKLEKSGDDWRVTLSGAEDFKKA